MVAAESLKVLERQLMHSDEIQDVRVSKKSHLNFTPGITCFKWCHF